MDERRGFGFRRNPPVREGEELDVKIEAVGSKGDGIAKKDGFVLFVPGVNEGDEVRIRVNRVLNKVGFAEVVGQAESTPEESSQEEPAEEEQAEENTEENQEEEAQDEKKGVSEEEEPAAEEEPKDTENFGE